MCAACLIIYKYSNISYQILLRIAEKIIVPVITKKIDMMFNNSKNVPISIIIIHQHILLIITQIEIYD